MPVISLIEIDDFCRRYNLDYKYFPFYEEIELTGDSVSVKLKPEYRFALLNNNLRDLNRNVVYREGKIYIPSSLEVLLKSFKKKSAGDLDSYLPVKIERVVIDPGHGGRDPGAISPWGLKEKHVNLTIAKYLHSLLKRKGFRVYMTRDRDVYVSLKDRVEFAKKKRADLFISVHANANHSRSLRGFEVYYLSPKFSDTQSKVLATAENLCQNEGLRLSSRLKGIIGRRLNAENKRETEMLVKSIMKSADNVGINTRKSVGAPFYVLKHNVCPAVLVEVGYLTNREEEKLIRTSLYRKQLALAIAEGVSRLENSLNKRIMAEK